MSDTVFGFLIGVAASPLIYGNMFCATLDVIPSIIRVIFTGQAKR